MPGPSPVAALVQVEHAHRIRRRVRDIAALAVWSDGDEVRGALYTDGRRNTVGRRVDYGDRVAAGIDRIDFVPNRVYRETSRLPPDLEHSILAQIDQVQHSDGVTCAIGYVGELMIVRRITREAIAPATEQRQGKQQAKRTLERGSGRSDSASCRLHPRLLRHCATNHAMYPN